MRVLAGIVVLIGLLAVSEAAVLVRFINTVPTRKYTTSMDQFTANGIQGTDATALTNFKEWAWPNPSWATANPSTDQADTASLKQDLVGLYYFPNAEGINNRHVVWTDDLMWIWSDQQRADLLTADFAPAPAAGSSGLSADDLATAFAVKNAMPPLRAYHRPRTSADSEAAAGDRVVNQDARDGTDIPYRPGVADYYTPDALRADGLGLYMSFAPGAYDFQAYGVTSYEKYLSSAKPTSAPAYRNLPFLFPQSAIALEFEDNKVYTIVATGAGSWSDVSKSTVALYSIEESTAPTTFGKAAIRFYHAIQPQASKTIDIYQGSTSTDPIYRNLPFSTSTTEYFDLSPAKTEVFPVAIQASTSNGGTSTVLLTNTQSSPSVSFDIIAGLRATAICASSFEDRTSEIFCRMIPSRVVSYVRLVADTAGYDILVDGKLGPQKLSETTLNLWASYELPKPAQTWSGNRDVSNAALAGVPAASVGLYPVVTAVAAGTISGYGEVHSPIFIMDFAVTPRIAPSCDDHIQSADYSATASTVPALSNAGMATNALFENGMGNLPSVSGSLCHNRATRAYQAQTYTWLSGMTNLLKLTPNPVATTPSTRWHEHAPVFKRINMILKSDGMATISNACNEDRLGNRPKLKADAGNAWVETYEQGNSLERSATLTDLYMEPGEYYSVYVLPTVTKLDTCETKKSSLNIQRRGGLRFGYSRDISLSESNQGVPDNKAYVSFLPMGDSTNWANFPTTGTGAVEGARLTATAASTAFTAADVSKSNIQHQQDFQGVLTIIKTGSASKNTFTIAPNTFNFREAEKTARSGELSGTTIAQINAGTLAWNTATLASGGNGVTLAYPQSDWAGYESQLASPSAAAWYVAPIAVETHELNAGEHTISHETTRTTDSTVTKATAFDCFGYIPSDTFTVESGKRYHYFVLNQFGCAQDNTGTDRTSADTSQLKGILVEVGPFQAPAATASSTEPVSAFFASASSVLTGSASSLTSSVVVLVAALLSVLAVVF